MRKPRENTFAVAPAHGVRHAPTPRPSLVQPSLLGLMNEQAVLRLIQSAGPVSRVEVARHLGVTAPTASKAADSLLQAGWLEEHEEETTGPVGRGRPAKQLRLPGERAQVIGVVIDAYRCQVVAAGLDGVLRGDQEGDGRIVFATPGTYEELITRIVQSVQTLTNGSGVTTFGLGISLPGLVDTRDQKGILSPNLPLTDGRSPARDIGAQFDFPCVQLQEEQALCLSERAYGSAQGRDDFAMLDITTGVGLGIVSGGQRLSGYRGLAGELGHTTVIAEGGKLCGCGNQGCLETEVSETSLARAISERLGRPVTVEEIAHWVSGSINPESDAEPAWAADVERWVRFSAIGVATVINLFNVSAVFVHSTVLAASPELFEQMVAQTRRRALAPSFADCEIFLAQGSKRRAAVATIMDYLIENRVPSVGR